MDKPSSQCLEKIGEQISCPVCLEHFANPRILPCFHSFCLHCLQGVPIALVDGNHSLPCPTCRSSCLVPDNGLASLPPSFVINNLLEVYELMKKVSAHQHASCDNCDNTDADSYCKQCAKFLCPQCLHFHDNWKPNAGHQILTLDEVAATAYQLPRTKQEQSVVCTDHDKPLEVFCEQCQQLICRDCTVKKHKDHDYDLVTDTYHQHKDAIVQCSLQPLNEEFHRLVDARQALAKRRNEISQNTEVTLEEIRQTITQIKKQLDETEKKLMEDVNLASKHKVSVIDQQMKELDTALGQVTDCRDHVELCVKVGSPQQVLVTKSQITSHTQSVIDSVKQNTFKPLALPDIKLLKSNISYNIGKIKSTFLPENVEVSHQHIPLTGKDSTITVKFSLSSSSNVPVSVPPSLISCCLISPNNSPPIQCSLKESSQSGQYNIVFTPLTRGLHQLHVTANGNNISGSPVSVPVSLPPEMKTTPVKVIHRRSSGIALSNNSGLMIVNDCGGHRVIIVDSEGDKLVTLGSEGRGKGQLKHPQGVVVSSKGTVLVSDSLNHRIQEFSMEGKCVGDTGSMGKRYSQFNCPRGLAIDPSTGNVLVADSGNHRIQVLHSDLSFFHTFGSEGSKEGKFSCPHDIAIDNCGFMYITDYNNHRVQKFSPDNQFVLSFGATELRYPSGIATDNDYVYINNDGSGFVSVYSVDGQYITQISKGSSRSLRALGWLNGVVCDSSTGTLCVCCYTDKQIKLF